MSTLRNQRRVEIFIFFVLLLCYVYFLPRWADWNVNSRMNVAFAVLDQHTLSIDNYYKNTGDYAFFEGHYYSDKAPGTSFLAIVFYAPYKFLGGNALVSRLASRLNSNSALAQTLDPNGRGLIETSLRYYAALVFVTFFALAIPSALLGILLYRLLLLWATRERDALLLTFAYGIATPVFAYGNNLYGHQLAASLLLASFYWIWQSVHMPRGNLYLALAGFALGMTVITEYPAALVVGGIGLYAIYKLRDARKISILILAGVPPIVLAALYNFAIFHTPLPVGYWYSTLYTDLHHTGLISLTYPKLGALWELAFGTQRGLFLLSPFLLLALPGFIFFAREKKWRAEFFLVLWSVLSFWLFNSSSAMWQGGFTVGPRYLIPMFPFLVMPIIFVMNRARGIFQIAIYALFVISLGLVWLQTLGGQTFPQYQLNPLLDYSIPQWRAGNILRNGGTLLGLHGVASLLPLALLLVTLLGVFVWTQRRVSVSRNPLPAPDSPTPTRV